MNTAGSTLSKTPAVESSATGVSFHDRLLRTVHSDEQLRRSRALDSVIGGITFGTKCADPHTLGNTKREMSEIFENRRLEIR